MAMPACRVPFVPLETPSFSIERNWSLKDLAGYLNTWSALQKYRAVHSGARFPVSLQRFPDTGSRKKNEKLSFITPARDLSNDFLNGAG